MNARPALEHILRLAAEETVASDYSAITPAHLLIALSRLSGEDAEPTTASMAVRDEFEQLGIEPRRFRRRLRALLGKGKTRYEGQVLHRSPVCKALFAQAALLAAKEPTVAVAAHLLRATFVTTWDLGQAAEDKPTSNPSSSPTDDIPDAL
jgi:hypothetical protein